MTRAAASALARTGKRAARAISAALLLASLGGGCGAGGQQVLPGAVVASFQLTGTPLDGGCVFSSGGELTPVEVEVRAAGTEAFVRAARAAPGDATLLSGTLEGTQLSASGALPAVGVAGCACAVVVTERLEGQLVVAEGASSFAGQLTATVEPAPDQGTCEPTTGDQDATCTLPCTVRWQVSGS